MDPWTIGLVGLIVVGLAAILLGALSDRAKNRRRAAEMLAPPQRAIPRFAPDAPAPRYLSELQARRPASGAAGEPNRADRETITAQLALERTVTIKAGYASKDFVTDPGTGRSVLDAPAILVCADPVDSIRELLPVLERLVLSRTPVVVIAPALAPEVRATLEVNAIRRTMSLLAVEAGDADRRTVAVAAGATAVDRSDRQAGYVLPEHLGHCDRWVSTAHHSHLITLATPGTD